MGAGAQRIDSPTRRARFAARVDLPTRGRLLFVPTFSRKKPHARTDQILYRRGLGRAGRGQTFRRRRSGDRESFRAHLAGLAADVDRAVAAARKAFETWSLTTREERLALLRRIKSELETRFDDLVDAITSEMGAPLSLSARGAGRGGAAASRRDHPCTERIAFEERSGRITLLHEPIGVCGLITPWNWPINQIALKVFPRSPPAARWS